VKFAVHICLSVCFLAGTINAYSQRGGFSAQPDTVVYEEELPDVEGPKANIFEGRPGRAALYSLIIPGAGQIYNRSYWKAPIVWGVIGAMGTVVGFNTSQYNDFDDRYTTTLIAEMEGEPNPDPSGLSSSQLFDLRTQANKNRQLSIVVLSFVWLGQSIEAFVDAHLKEFDVGDDLSIQLRPIGLGEGPAIAQTGIVIRF